MEGSLFDVPPAAFGRFRVLHQIGAGSLGPVFRGEDPARPTPVAIKSLQVDLPPERSRAVVDELSGLAARLPMHPAVVVPIDAGLADLVPYVVWPLLPGESLAVALREYGPAACVDALPRLAAIADALDESAANGVWHGALHPRDVMVSDDDTWVTGLGVAPTLERAGVRLPARRPYTAPEQLDGQATSPRSDQFALAAIAHEWLFGRRVAGPTDRSLTVPLLPGVDRDRMTEAFAVALAADPEARFASAADFVLALERSVVDEQEAKLESAARMTRRRVRTPPSAAPILPLETADGAESPLMGLDSEEPAEPPRFLVIDDDDPMDRLAEPHGPSNGPAFETGEEAVPSSGGPLLRSAEFPSEVDSAGVEPVTDEPAEPEGRADIAEAPLPEPFDRGPESYAVPAFAVTAPESGGGFGAGTVVAALFVGLVIGMAGGYALASRQPATLLPADEVSRQTSVAGEDEVARPADSPGAESGLPAAGAGEPPTPAVPAEPPARAAAEPAAAAAPPAGEAEDLSGRLLVRSTPAGAEVQVGGESRGATPLALRDLPFGTHAVTVVLDGFAPARHQVALTPARPSRSLDVELERPAGVGPPAAEPRRTAATTGSLVIVSRPPGATVRIDDREAGATPLTLPTLAPGRYVVTILREGYQPWITTVQVVAGDQTRVAASLVGGRLEE